MKFLLVAGFADSLVNFRGPLLAALKRNRLEVHVAAPGLSSVSKSREWLESNGYIFHEIPLQRAGTNPLADFFLFISLLRLIWRVKPIYFLAYTIKPVIYGSLAARLAGVPKRFALITGLGYAFAGESVGARRWVSAAAKVLYKLALRRLDVVFFQNPDDMTDFKNYGLVANEVLACVVNGSGIDLSAYPVRQLPSGPLRFLLIARLLGDKGVREYAAAARIIRKRYSDVEFHLVGGLDENPSSIPELEVQSWHDSRDLTWHGHQDDVRPYLANCHVYILPSYYREGVPRTILEALSTGRPVITTDSPGCRETVVEGVNGFLVLPRSVEHLVAAIEKFINDPDLVGLMAKRARQIAEDKYDVDKVNASMLREMGLV